MELEVSFKELQQRYPESIKEIEAKIKKGRSKHKNDDLTTFKWYFTYAVRIEGSGTLASVLQGAKNLKLNLPLKKSWRDLKEIVVLTSWQKRVRVDEPQTAF